MRVVVAFLSTLQHSLRCLSVSSTVVINRINVWQGGKLLDRVTKYFVLFLLSRAGCTNQSWSSRTRVRSVFVCCYPIYPGRQSKPFGGVYQLASRGRTGGKINTVVFFSRKFYPFVLHMVFFEISLSLFCYSLGVSLL